MIDFRHIKFAMLFCLAVILSSSLSAQIIEVDPSEVPTEILEEIESGEEIQIPTQPELIVTPTGEKIVPVDGTETDTDDPNLTDESEDSTETEEDDLEDQDEVKSEDVDPATIDIRSPPTIYGHQFFRRNNIKSYNNSANIKAPEDYVLGTGDELGISIYGFAEYNERFVIEQDGYVQPFKVGRIYLKGLTFKAAREVIKQKFSRAYNLSNSTLDLTLIYSRTININFIGEVYKPGNYKIPAVNTAFNALSAVGGPNNIGTVRNVQIKRAGRTIETLDVYKYLMNQNSYETFLETGDYIYVPVAGKIVSIGGEVKRPFKYELLENEGMKDLVKYAGGLTSAAFTQNIQVVRFDQNKKILIDINLSNILQGYSDFSLQDGDEIHVSNIPDLVTNFFIVNGSVRLPGKYELKQGMKLTDAINMSEGLKFDAYLKKAYLIRVDADLRRKYFTVDLDYVINNPTSDGNLDLKNADQIFIFSKEKFRDSQGVKISGAVREPGTFNFGADLHISDLLTLAGGLTKEAFLERAYLVRKDSNLRNVYYQFSLNDVLNGVGTDADFDLEPKDRIKVFSKETFIDEVDVEIFGPIRSPGKYEYGRNLMLKDLVLLAGGFKITAANQKIEISRVANYDEVLNGAVPERITVYSEEVSKDLRIPGVGGEFLLEPYDQIFVRSLAEFELQRNIILMGEVKYPGTYSLESKDVRISDIIARAGGLTDYAFAEGATMRRKQNNVGPVFLDLKRVMTVDRNNPIMNYTMEHGDVLTIPRVKELVRLVGAYNHFGSIHANNYITKRQVENLNVRVDSNDVKMINIPYHRGKSAKYYIDEYGGGFSRDAKRKDTYVVSAAGKVSKTKRFLFAKNYPNVDQGSTVYTLFKEPKKERKPIGLNFENTFNSVLTSTTAVLNMFILYKIASDL